MVYLKLATFSILQSINVRGFSPVLERFLVSAFFHSIKGKLQFFLVYAFTALTFTLVLMIIESILNNMGPHTNDDKKYG